MKYLLANEIKNKYLYVTINYYEKIRNAINALILKIFENKFREINTLLCIKNKIVLEFNIFANNNIIYCNELEIDISDKNKLDIDYDYIINNYIKEYGEELLKEKLKYLFIGFAINKIDNEYCLSYEISH